MLRTPIRMATVVKAAAAVSAAGGLLTACAPVQMGAAAIVGNQSISATRLSNEVSQLVTAAKPYSGAVQVSQSQAPKQVLSWLIRFDVREQLARREGITVTQAQTQQALTDIYNSASQQAAAAGQSNVSLTELAVANGLPPNLLDELGRYQAIEIAYAQRANGGKLPTSTSAVNSITNRFNQAECQVYKNVPIKVNPQFGTMNYKQDAVVAAPDTLSRAEGDSGRSAGTGSTPSC